MPRIPVLPPGSLRLFARVSNFVCECPRCGTICSPTYQKPINKTRREVVRLHQRRQKGAHISIKHQTSKLRFNPLTSRLTCSNCHSTWAVGLLLYPVAHGDQHPQEPYDHRAIWAQVLAMRQLTGGFFVGSQEIGGADSVNLLIENACTCDERRGGGIIAWSSTCPVHGWEEQLQPKTTLTEVARMTLALIEERERQTCDDVLEGTRGHVRCELKVDHPGAHAMGRRQWGRTREITPPEERE